MKLCCSHSVISSEDLADCSGGLLDSHAVKHARTNAERSTERDGVSAAILLPLQTE